MQRSVHKLSCQVVTTHLQDKVLVPSDGVGVKVSCWVEPKENSLLTPASPI